MVYLHKGGVVILFLCTDRIVVILHHLLHQESGLSADFATFFCTRKVIPSHSRRRRDSPRELRMKKEVDRARNFIYTRVLHKRVNPAHVIGKFVSAIFFLF